MPSGRKKLKVSASTNGEDFKELNMDKLPTFEEPTFIITEAKIKDDFCHYKLEMIAGVNKGDPLDQKGTHIITDDMRTAFAKFNVHLAVIDDVFKHSQIEIDDIDKYHTDDLTRLFIVTGFKIKGSEENESIILVGNKYVNVGGRIELESPKIPLDNLSSYKWYNELKTAADNARSEVKLYREGKYILVEEDEEETAEQGNLFQKPSPSELMADFDNAKVE